MDFSRASSLAPRPDSWLSSVRRGDGPLYKSILRALEDAIRSGALQAGDRLPPQRAVADRLGVDITTVTRAYSEAGRRGWLDGAVGRGTFVRADALQDDPGRIDLSMNLPPAPAGVSLADMIRDTTVDLMQRHDAARLMAYHPGAGAPGQQLAGAAWISPCLADVPPARVLVAPGAQAALSAILGALCAPGDAVVVEPLTYPGFRQVAERFGLRLLACPADADGFLPEDLARLCRDAAPKLIYLVPTLQNPTASTTSPERRQAIAEVARAAGAWIVEDDPYSRLLEAPPASVGSFAPERTFYLATLAKTLTPGLRIAYLAVPEGEEGERVGDALRAIALMPPPLMAAMATAWVRDGRAEHLLAGVRREARARCAIARRILPQAYAAAEESLHVWLDLPSAWDGDSLRRAGQQRGLSLVGAEAFATGPETRNGVRISLGGPETQDVLTTALMRIAELVAQDPPRP